MEEYNVSVGLDVHKNTIALAVPSIYSSAAPRLDSGSLAAPTSGMLFPYICCLVSAFKTRCELALENLALRQQLAVLRRSVKRPCSSLRPRILGSLIQPWCLWCNTVVF